ncbi:hypothetical protein [Mycobacterium deserti]|uniref:DUF222 domain-containing protein n=1 Tax=Mycobacterium deserti TaxID=2978347 RepID=A0ABT2MD50_9MYCO|nr:hypothetical protein [Mycobacterium deserti]MCT7660199.1 hypothetical protein [Mycobacterium deserti]
MSSAHPDLGPELRRLAQMILDRLDPAVRSAAALAGSGDGPGKCQQVWCPVCAIAALASGEQHPLLTVVAEHSVALLAVVRAILDADTQQPDGTPPQGPPPPPEGPPQGPAPSGASRYQHIPVTVEE